MTLRRVYFVRIDRPAGPPGYATMQTVVGREGMRWVRVSVKAGLIRVIKIERYKP